MGMALLRWQALLLETTTLHNSNSFAGRLFILQLLSATLCLNLLLSSVEAAQCIFTGSINPQFNHI